MTQHRIVTEVAFVRTEDGVVRLGQGDTLPEGVAPAELARLANGGVLEGFEPAADPGDQHGPDVVDGNPAEIKVRVGDDPAAARAYLDAENARETPRKTLVAHLEAVIAAGAPETQSS